MQSSSSSQCFETTVSKQRYYIPFVAVDTVEDTQTDGRDDPKGGEQTHANEQTEGDETQHWLDDGAVLWHLAPYNMRQ